jgi:hypothetical protein
LDLAVANYVSSDVSVLMGNIGGTFQPPLNYPVVAQPRSVAVGNFNGDNRPDLAVTNINGNNVSVLLCNLSGSLQNAVNYSTATQPYSVTVGDFNADGRPDLAVAAIDNSVSVLLNACVVLSTSPTITFHPVSVSTFSGREAVFTIAASPAGGIGGGVLEYQWRRSGVPLADGHTPTGAQISGATTPMLMLSEVALADNGAALDCVVTEAGTGGWARSDPAGLGVTPRCPVDFNQDGGADVRDFLAFLAAYAAGC